MNRVLFKQMFQAEAHRLSASSTRPGSASVNEILAVYLMAKKFGVPVCPHAGWCRAVRACPAPVDLRLRRGVRVSLEGRVTEYVDHLHEHFVDPCVVEGGAYACPTAPGYSAEMASGSIEEFAYPDGSYWAGVLAG